jgi:hypothetical protein
MRPFEFAVNMTPVPLESRRSSERRSHERRSVEQPCAERRRRERRRNERRWQDWGRMAGHTSSMT